MLYDKYILDSYVVQMDRESWLFGGDKLLPNLTVWLSNFLFTCSKLLYSTFAFLIDLVFKLDVLVSGATTVFSIANSLYQALFDLLIIPIVLFGAVYYFYEYLTNSTKKANRFALTFFLVLSLNIGFYSKGAEIITTVKKGLDTIELSFYKVATSHSLGFFKEKSDNDLILNANNVNSASDTITSQMPSLLKNYLFEQLVADTFMTLNFGQLKFDEEKAKAYLVATGTEDVKKALEENVKKANSEKTEVYFSEAKGFEKILISLLSIGKAIFVGGAIVIIMLFKVLLQLMVLAMIFFLPLLSIIAFIPQFNHVLFKYVGQGFALLCASPVVSFIAVVILWVFNTIDNMIIKTASANATGVEQFFSSMLIKVVLLWLAYKYRHKLLALLSTGNVVHSVAPVFNSNTKRYSDNNPYNDKYSDDVLRQILLAIQQNGIQGNGNESSGNNGNDSHRHTPNKQGNHDYGDTSTYQPNQNKQSTEQSSYDNSVDKGKTYSRYGETNYRQSQHKADDKPTRTQKDFNKAVEKMRQQYRQKRDND